MHINLLPFDIIDNIVSKAVVSQAGNITEWKQTIPLLAVCRSWRIISAKWVHNWAYVECYDDTDTTSETDDLQSSFSLNVANIDSISDVQSENTITWATNIGFLTLHRNAPLAKVLDVHMEVEATVPQFLKTLITQLCADRYSWASTRVLRLYLKDYVQSDAPLSTRDIKLLGNLSSKFGKCFRNIKKLVVFAGVSSQYSLALCEFYSKLVCEYSTTLVTLCANVPLKYVYPVMFDHLTSLRVNMSFSSSGFLPIVHSDILETLYIYNAPPDIPWNQFVTFYKTPGHVSFSRLRSLTLIFYDSTIASDKPPMLQWKNMRSENIVNFSLPVLESLRLESPPDELPELCTRTLCPNMHTLHIAASLNSVMHLLTRGIRRLNELFINLNCNEKSKVDDFYALTNYLFGDIEVKTEAIFFIESLPFRLDPSRVCWANLTQIGIRHNIEYFVLIRLMSCLPKLVELRIHNLNLNKLHFEYRQASCNLGSADMVHLTLQNLMIDGDFSNYTKPFVCFFFKRVLSALITLRKLSIYEQYMCDISTILLENPSICPNLKAVCVA